MGLVSEIWNFSGAWGLVLGVSLSGGSKTENAPANAAGSAPMPILNGKYWEERYQASDMPWDKGEASPGLVDFLAAHPELKRGTVCVPGCGTGHDVRVWAKAGFHAVGYDIAPSAAQLGRERTAAAGLMARSGWAPVRKRTSGSRIDRRWWRGEMPNSTSG